MCRWIRKHGDDVQFRIIEECQESLLNERERFWIAFYRSRGQAYLNILDGGDGVSPDNVRGERNPRAALTWDIVKEIRAQRLVKYVDSEELAERYGVGALAIRRVVANSSWHDPNYDQSRVVISPWRSRWFSAEMASEIRDLRTGRWIPNQHVAKRYGISVQTLRRVLANEYHPDPNFDPGLLVPTPSGRGLKRGVRLNYHEYFPD